MKYGVESSNTAESGRHRNLGKRQLRFVDQLLREMKPAGLRDRDRGRSEVLHKQSPEMTGSNPKLVRQVFDAAIVQRAFRDQPERS